MINITITEGHKRGGFFWQVNFEGRTVGQGVAEKREKAITLASQAAQQVKEDAKEEVKTEAKQPFEYITYNKEQTKEKLGLTEHSFTKAIHKGWLRRCKNDSGKYAFDDFELELYVAWKRRHDNPEERSAIPAYFVEQMQKVTA